jgi:hypothetical protein
MKTFKVTTHFGTALAARMKWGAGLTSDTVTKRSKHEYFYMRLAPLKHAFLACDRMFISGIQVLKQTFQPVFLILGSHYMRCHHIREFMSSCVSCN